MALYYFKQYSLYTDLFETEMENISNFDLFENFKINEIKSNFKDRAQNVYDEVINQIRYYIAYLKEFSNILEIQNKKKSNFNYVQYALNDNVWIKDNGSWKLGTIQRVNLKNDTYVVELKILQLINIINISGNSSNLYMTLKKAILNILNRDLLSNTKKRQLLNEIFDEELIYDKFLTINNKTSSSSKQKKHILCKKHTNKKTCNKISFCKWDSEKNTIAL